MATGLRLVVEVISARDLMAKLCGTSNPYVKLRFVGQKVQTSIKMADLNPVWNEQFVFYIYDTYRLPSLELSATVYNYKRLDAHNAYRQFLGKVEINGSSFVSQSDAKVQLYPLREKSFLHAPVIGELCLRVYIADDSNPYVSSVPPLDILADDTIPSVSSGPSQNCNLQSESEGDKMNTVHHLPKQDQQQPPSVKTEATVSDQGMELFGDEKKSEFLQAHQQPVDFSVKDTNPSVRLVPSLDILADDTNPSVSLVPSQNCNLQSESEGDKMTTVYHLPKQDQQQPPSVRTAATVSDQGMELYGNEKKSEFLQAHQQPLDFSVKETSPFLGGGQIVGGRLIRSNNPAKTFDLVEQMQYLFVRVVRARELHAEDASRSLDPYVEVKVGNYKGVTEDFEKKEAEHEWNEVFAFSGERIQASFLEIVVKDKVNVKDEFVGVLRFDLNEVPVDSTSAPEWYHVKGKEGDKLKGQLMVAVWFGTQADEAFQDAWNSDAALPATEGFVEAGAHLRSKVYIAPWLWYVRLNVIQAQDLIISDSSQFSDVYVKAQIGCQILKTRTIQVKSLNPVWNEDLIFVAAEPFEEHIVLSVVDQVSPNKDKIICTTVLPLNSLPKRYDDKLIDARWFSLKFPVAVDVDQPEIEQFATRIQLRIFLDGGYHVSEESTNYSSDLRPSAKQLCKPSIGILELGILSAKRLHRMKTRDGQGTTDAFCVAKYGDKWARTRTVVNSLNAKFNEQFTWEVYDPATVLTVAVFDNSFITEIGSSSNCPRIGKVRIRLSTLETGRVYTHSYPLLMLRPSGVEKMGELHLAVRFSCTSLLNMLNIYFRPLLPKMHYVRPLPEKQLNALRCKAVTIVAERLGRAEPPLSKEVVDYITDVKSHLWSMRKSRTNYFRLESLFSHLSFAGKWFADVCSWRNPITTAIIHRLFIILVSFPGLILPIISFSLFFIGIWNYRCRARYPPQVITRSISCPDELDEEFDTFPSSKAAELVRMRYDRLRIVAGKIQAIGGDIATEGERVLSLLNWRDPRATSMFVLFCLLAAVVLWVTPFKVVAVISGFYGMRHPIFRRGLPLPSAPINFFRRLPAEPDSI